MTNLKSYQLAVEFYRQAQGVSLPRHLKDQFLRASSSVALNLAEGSAKPTSRDRHRFYRIALGSVRECEAIVQLSRPNLNHLAKSLDILARHVFKLCKALS